MEHIYILLIYAAFITIVSVAVTAIDKKSAQVGGRRISEKTLMVIGLSGGALPMLITMKAIRHKTRHPKFMVGLPLVILLQTAIITAVICYSGR